MNEVNESLSVKNFVSFFLNSKNSDIVNMMMSCDTFASFTNTLKIYLEDNEIESEQGIDPKIFHYFWILQSNFNFSLSDFIKMEVIKQQGISLTKAINIKKTKIKVFFSEPSGKKVENFTNYPWTNIINHSFDVLALSKAIAKIKILTDGVL